MRTPAFTKTKDRLPELGTRVVCIELWQASHNTPVQYSLQIANYKIDNVWGRGNKPVFLNEQDEQPGVINPDYWMAETDLLLLITNPQSK